MKWRLVCAGVDRPLADRSLPFRWDVSSREQLGALIDDIDAPLDDWYVEELRRSAARVISQSKGADLVFVGRSPESYVDYLSGVFCGVPAAPDLILFQHSGRWMNFDSLRAAEQQALRNHLRALRIDADGIASRRCGIAFCDLVARGGTFRGLIKAQAEIAFDSRHGWRDIQRKIRLIGITVRSKTSPNTWRWYQHRDWGEAAPHVGCSSVSVSPLFWDTLGNVEAKTTRPHSIDRWIQEPTIRRDKTAIQALARAAALFDLGRSPAERARFASVLATEGDMRQAFLRTLIGSIRG